jgi:hypothetical protein
MDVVRRFALGYADACFPPEVGKVYPVLTYEDVYTVLCRIKPGEGPFGYLVRDYRAYLEGETQIRLCSKICGQEWA